MNTLLSICTGPGIGVASAARFAAEGFHTVLSSRTPAKQQAFSDTFRQAGGSGEPMHFDASDAASSQSPITSVLAHRGAIDVLHYNAASLRHARIADQPAGSKTKRIALAMRKRLTAAQHESRCLDARNRPPLMLVLDNPTSPGESARQQLVKE